MFGLEMPPGDWWTKMAVLSSKVQCHENFDLFFVLTGIGAPWLSIYNIVEYHVSNLGISDTELETILKNSSPGPLFFLFSLFAKWKISIHCGKSIKFKIVLLIIVVLCWYTWYCVLSTLCLKSHFIIYLSVLDLSQNGLGSNRNYFSLWSITNLSVIVMYRKCRNIYWWLCDGCLWLVTEVYGKS